MNKPNLKTMAKASKLNWQDFDDWLKDHKYLEDSCGKPGCPIPKRKPRFDRCTIANGILLYVPPGEHRHIECPVHGEHIIYGSTNTWCEKTSVKWEYKGPLPEVRM